MFEIIKKCFFKENTVDSLMFKPEDPEYFPVNEYMEDIADTSIWCQKESIEKAVNIVVNSKFIFVEKKHDLKSIEDCELGLFQAYLFNKKRQLIEAGYDRDSQLGVRLVEYARQYLEARGSFLREYPSH